LDITFRNTTYEDTGFYFLIRKTTIKPYIEKYAEWDEEKELGAIPSKINPMYGKIILSKGESIGLLELKETDDTIYLDILNIVPKYQCRGLGTWLICSIKDEAVKKNKHIKLDTYQNNTRAITLYLRNGFQIVGLGQQPNKYPKVFMEYKP
jgi:ribosomal protein S18 acetylase RimI-like enzyme